MSDERERAPEAEIVDLPSGGHGSGTAVAGRDDTGRGAATPGAGSAPTVDLPSSRRRVVARAGDGRQIVCEGLVRIYKVADLEVVALQGLDLVVGVGEMI